MDNERAGEVENVVDSIALIAVRIRSPVGIASSRSGSGLCWKTKLVFGAVVETS